MADYGIQTVVSDKAASQLSRIKKNVEKSTIYFKENAERFHDFTKFVYKTAISIQDESVLRNMGKPIIEFNITNAPVSRLCGEFSKQEPSIIVKTENGIPVDPQIIRVVEGHIRHIFDQASKHNTQYMVYKDQMVGGYSVFKIWTDYAHEMSFDQVINFGRVYEPTLCGFDPNAREVDKRDAEFCFEKFPMPLEKFKKDYPKVDLSNMQFMGEGTTNAWAYTNESDLEDIIVVCDYYEKKRKRFKIVKLANKKVMKLDDYKDFLTKWAEQGFTEQPPAIVGEPRWTEQVVICRYRLIGNQIIEYKETNFKYLPLIFVDGDSIIIKDDAVNTYSQFTKPYVYHAKGIQRLTNFSGQVIANDFENMVMHKFMVAKESIPQEEEYQEAYKNVQIASTLVYNQYMDGDVNKQLNQPREVQRVPLPQEVIATFTGSMQMLQNILGTYDAALGINDNQLSGTAIVEAATQSNSAAMPYVVSHMQSLSHAANVILDLIPKYYVTPRTIPVVNRDGTREYVRINQPGGIDFNYDDNVLSVSVEAGPNFAIQKTRALQQISVLMQSSPLFAQFMNEVGLDFLLDNMEFRGADILAERAKMWMMQLQQRQQQAAQQPNPMMLQEQNEQLRLQQKQQEVQVNAQLKAAELQLQKQKIDTDRLNTEANIGVSQAKIMVDLKRAEAEESRAAADIAIKHMDMNHKHDKEHAEVLIKGHVAKQKNVPIVKRPTTTNKGAPSS